MVLDFETVPKNLGRLESLLRVLFLQPATSLLVIILETGSVNCNVNL